MEPLEVVVAQFYTIFVGSQTPQIYILDQNKLWESFLTETENWYIHEITSPWINKKNQSIKIGHHNFKWSHSIW